MKVRVCPQCGKHNQENAWNCTECGTVLPLKTLMDTESGELLGVTSIAGYTALWEISGEFEQDVVRTLQATTRPNESIIWGCNYFGPKGYPANVFGYLIITSNQMICVQFAANIIKNKTSFLQFLLNPLAYFVKEVAGVNDTYTHSRPGEPLTPSEIQTRKVIVKDLNQITSVRIIPGHELAITMEFQKEQGWEFSLYSQEHAEKAFKILNAHVNRSAIPVQPN